MTRRIYTFAVGKSDGGKDMKNLLGNKGCLLCEMARLGVNVPPGFTITTEVCQEFSRLGNMLPDGLIDEVKSALAEVEKNMGKKFGDLSDPLLFSVRSGAAVSMPGMMDTVLNLGLNDSSVEGLAQKYGKRFAYDCYRRLLAMYGNVVLGIKSEFFEQKIDQVKAAQGVKQDVELSGDSLQKLVELSKEVYKSSGHVLPQDPFQQLEQSIIAVFQSYNTPRAIKYREINKIQGVKGTAVNIQSMVYGNLSDNSGTGVCFSRNPATGERGLWGEFLPNAQGEDVVSGVRTPLPIHELKRHFPGIYEELDGTVRRLEGHLRNMQDSEFTVQDGRLFMLQTRNAKRTGMAAVTVATDMVQEKLITPDEAILLVEPRHLEQLLHPMFKDESKYRSANLVLATGLAASPGAGIGKVVFTAEDAVAWHKKGEDVLLCRQDTSPDDVGGMHAARGIITQRGGMTSHAAVVARGWGKPCVCGCATLTIDEKKKTITCKGVTLKEGDFLSLNGTTGEVIKGKHETKEPEIAGNLATFMGMADAARKLKVMANADSPEDAMLARKNGAEGIGLCRTEHMFFSSAERIHTMQAMIASTELHSPEQAQALTKLQTFQQQDFEGLFRAMDGQNVTIRLLDPPLHEFLPAAGPALEKLCKQLAKDLRSSPSAIHSRLDSLREVNPMMGLRGCRLGIVHPEISEMQCVAIFRAAAACIKDGVKCHPEIMIPLVGIVDELESQTKLVRKAASEVQAATGVNIPYKVGTMIEVPRGALMAGSLAQTAEFFSFGSNDLTQLTFGISRDDAQAKFLTFYRKEGLLPSDPFETIDEEGVGSLIKMAIERGRAARPDIEIGVCGEHGGDPDSVTFFHKVGLRYVSCSPMRVPVARLASAQAAIRAAK